MTEPGREEWEEMGGCVNDLNLHHYGQSMHITKIDKERNRGLICCLERQS